MDVNSQKFCIHKTHLSMYKKSVCVCAHCKKKAKEKKYLPIENKVTTK